MYECNDYSDVLEDFSINSMYKVLKLSIWEDVVKTKSQIWHNQNYLDFLE